MRRGLVVTFDAFGTLFYPREPIGKQYADVARRHHLSGFTDDQISTDFKKAFKTAQIQYPNYGRATGLGPTAWWSNVIRSTFSAHVRESAIPAQVTQDLLQQFSSSAGYELYSGVSDFFSKLADLKRRSPRPSLQIGIISNSDDRISPILESFGFKVGPSTGKLSTTHKTHSISRLPQKPYDFDFVTLSYDVGFEKPDRRIFEAAQDSARLLSRSDELGMECDLLHVGDEWEKDVVGARGAGWAGARLGEDDRASPRQPEEGLFFPDMNTLYAYIETKVL